MNNKQKDIKKEFADAAGMLASRLSLSPIAGQIYGLLYLSEEPVSLNDMVDRLSISKASASTNVRALESWNAVRKIWVSNSRRDFYEANPNIIGVVSEKLRDGLSKRLEEFKGAFEPVSSGKTSSINTPDDFTRNRIEHLKKLYSAAEDALKNLPEILSFISGSSDEE